DKRLSDVIDLLPDPSLVVNHDGVVIAWNKAMTALTGVEAEEMLGKGDKEYALPFYGRRRPLLIDFVLSGDKDVLSWYSHPFLEGNIITAETIPIRLKGKDVMLWARASPFFDDQGRLLGAIETVRDVTEWKRTEMALKQTNRQLNTLADITRHDILNTLTVLRGRVDLAEMRTADPAFISHLKQEDALLQKIEDQIMFTKLYQSLGLSEPTWQALAAIVDGLEPRRDIEIINDCDTFEVFADPMLPRAFDNLFDNAVRHGRHVSTIRVSSKPDGDKLLIRFEDDGCGVPNKEKELIFERGYGRNTGLGLFLVKEILAITGLSISESGEEGRGAVFEISVPLANYRTIK
ncbi:MAG TPA: PAS domain-containing sensor histidine kinase, partial [Methanomassiliicoccales archaeon]|nr:PAS domain-containing sensor histidine kinase [Methanomassiliicoccales archaeon]